MIRLNIIEKAPYDKPGRERMYYSIESPIGRITAYTMEADEHTSISYRNLSLGDVCWSMTDKETFITRHRNDIKPVETFASSRISFPRDRISIDCGLNGRYQLAEKRKSDGYLYEIPASEIRAYPATHYPEMRFAYTRYHIEALRDLPALEIERLKTEETIRFNRGNKHSSSAVSTIVGAVYDYINGKGSD